MLVTTLGILKEDNRKKITVLQTVPRSESLYAFLNSIKTASGRNTMELDADDRIGDVLRDLRGYT